MDDLSHNATPNITTSNAPGNVRGRDSSSSLSPSHPSEISSLAKPPDSNDSIQANKASSDGDTGGVEQVSLAKTESLGSNGGLNRDITMRQMFLMAAGGSIGAGLFVGSGQALSTGGPASLVINFAICGFMVSMTMASLGEMATSYPVAGAFYDYTVRFVGKTAGFAMGWNFVFNWLIVLPFELTTIGAQLEYWNANLEPWWFVLPFMIVLALISSKGAKWFGEVEHWLGLCKAVSLITFICFALALITKGSGAEDDKRGALGDRYWHEPGAFRHGFQGFLAVFRVAGMSYGGTEMLGLTAAECRRPHRVMPMATKIVFFRLIVFYVGDLLMLGFVVPSDDENLSAVGHGAKYSPFVLAANLAKQPALANFFNAMIVTALVSMANAAVFASSRALQALCSKGMGPRKLSELKRGVPVYALAVAFALALLAFVMAAPGGEQIFDWLLSLSAMSNYMTWAAICYSHIRMRKAMKAQGLDQRQIIWRSPFGVWGSYVGLLVCGCGLLAQVVIACWPLKGYDAKAVTRDVIGIPFMLAIFYGYAAHQKWKVGVKRLMVPLAEIDLVTGFRNKEYARVADEEAAKEKEMILDVLGYQKEWSMIKKASFHAQQGLNFEWVQSLRNWIRKAT